MKEIGIDENGFGSLMGPLVITGTSIEWERQKWFEKVKDSKNFFSSRNKKNFKKLEEFVISIYYCLNGKMPGCPYEIISFFSHGFKCSTGINLCLKNLPEKFLWADTVDAKSQGEEISDWMKQEKIKLKNIKAEIVCVRNFNEFIKKGNSKFLIDLFSFCRIVRDLKEENVLISAGKIGGMKFYLKYLRYFFPDYQIYPEIEDEGKSIYIFEGEKENFKFGFFLNVEEISFSASMSSIVGKYIREIFMEGIRNSLGIKENISGYRDRKTKNTISSLSSSFPSICLYRIR